VDLLTINDLVKVAYKETKISLMVYRICSFLHVEFLVANWFCIHVLETLRNNKILFWKNYLIIIISTVIGIFIFCMGIIIFYYLKYCLWWKDLVLGSVY
jgi:hypothetical protein